MNFFSRFVTSSSMLAALVLATTNARAATFGWSGFTNGAGSGAGTAWLVPGNWTNNLGTPTNTDIAFFGAGGTGTNIGFNFQAPPATSTNIGAIVLGAGSTVDRYIGSSATAAGQATWLYFYGSGTGLLTNAVTGRTLFLNPLAAGGSGNGMTNVLLTSGVIEAVGNIQINNSIAEAGGSRTITKTGAGSLTLGAQITFSGKTIINGARIASAQTFRGRSLLIN
jgi:autotransporter-associated beta strand protein